MPERLINWEWLKPYDKDQCRSFEELCYQVAKKLYESQGQFTSIDDSGGGDGVEFFLTLANGDQWGWQAKLYLPGESLDAGGRKAAIHHEQYSGQFAARKRTGEPVHRGAASLQISRATFPIEAGRGEW